MKNLSQDSQSLGRDLKPKPSESKAGVLTTSLQCLILVKKKASQMIELMALEEVSNFQGNK
jgi:hypothetical protein